VILPDIEILSLVRRDLVTPFDPELVNPASLDVRLGENLLVELPTSTSILPYSIAGNDAGKSVLAPAA
jgi:dCTP deaminase